MYRLSIFMIILLYLSASSVTKVRSEENTIHDTTHNWRWVVPLGKYDYCDIIPINGLIKVGTKVGEQSLGNAGPVLAILAYGLLDRDGNPLTEIVFNEIGTPNSDGYMLAILNEEDGRTQNMVINHLGHILPTPEDAVITLFDRSYSAETADELILYVNNKSYTIPKSELRHIVALKSPVNVLNVYSSCFILERDRYVYVFGYDGTLRYMTDRYLSDSPQGLIVSNEQGKSGFVDFDGNVIVPAVYDGLRQVYQTPKLFTYSIDSMDQMRHNRYKMMDINNPKAFVGLEYSGTFYSMDYNNHLLYLSAYINDQGDMRGLYSFDGRQILPFEYEDIGRLCDGLIRFESGNYTGYTNLDGNVVFEKECYRYAGLSQDGSICLDRVFSLFDFSEGLAGYWDADNGKGYINLDFVPVIKLSDEWEIRGKDGMFHDGLAAVTFQGELVFINRQGEIVIAAQPGQQPWKDSDGFSNGLAAVSAREPVTGGYSALRDAFNYGAVGVISSEISQ